MLALGPASTTTIESDGTLRVIGATASPATVTGSAGGGYSLSVHGTLAARDYAFEQMGAAGVVLSATSILADPPLDGRGGVFRQPDATPGSVMLDLALGGAIGFRYVDFEDPSGVGTFNVRRLAGADVTFFDSRGNFAGPTFEDDPGERVHWVDDPTLVDRFLAQPGPRRVTLEWTTSAEGSNLVSLVLQSSSSAAGPFTTLVEEPVQGPSSYGFLHQPLMPDTTVFYRLLGRDDSGYDRWLAAAQATPWVGQSQVPS